MLGVTFALQLDDQTLHYLAAGTGVVLIGVITWLNNSRNQNEDEQNVVGNTRGGVEATKELLAEMGEQREKLTDEEKKIWDKAIAFTINFSKRKHSGVDSEI